MTLSRRSRPPVVLVFAKYFLPRMLVFKGIFYLNASALDVDINSASK